MKQIMLLLIMLCTLLSYSQSKCEVFRTWYQHESDYFKPCYTGKKDTMTGRVELRLCGSIEFSIAPKPFYIYSMVDTTLGPPLQHFHIDIVDSHGYLVWNDTPNYYYKHGKWIPITDKRFKIR